MTRPRCGWQMAQTSRTTGTGSPVGLSFKILKEREDITHMCMPHYRELSSEDTHAERDLSHHRRQQHPDKGRLCCSVGSQIFDGHQQHRRRGKQNNCLPQDRVHQDRVSNLMFLKGDYLLQAMPFSFSGPFSTKCMEMHALTLWSSDGEYSGANPFKADDVTDADIEATVLADNE